MTTGQQMSMKEIFVQCQSSMQGHAKLLKAMKQLYKQADFVDFWSEFCHYMKYSMIVFKREPAVERTIDFIAKFVTSVNPEEEADPDDSQVDEVSQNKLLVTVFDFLLQSHCARDKAVRFRCCQMINKLLNNLGENAQIDDDLYDRIYESMLERLRDKFPVVRLHAVMAVSRLQDPRDENCPVIKAYLFLINADPNPEVRRAVLSCIAPSTKTLPAILQRTRDVKDIVRKMAFSVMGEKVHIKALSIAHRVQLLQDGLNDRTDSVKDTCSSKLLQAWLRTFQGNVLDLLTSLDVESATKTCQLTLQTLFKSSPTDELVTKFDLLDENILIPMEKLTCESVTYWQTLCKYIYDMGTDGDADLEKVLPNCVEYCKYTSNFVESLKNCEDLDQQVEKEFILQELLLLVDYMDLADQASRKAVEKLFHDMLIADHVGHTMIKCIVPKLCEIRDSADSSITYIAEMVSEIREPITTIEKGPTPDEKRQNDIKIAGIRVKLNQAKEELEECIQNQDFSRAAELKSSISELDAEKSQLMEMGESQVEEVRTEKTDVATILKCQTMVTEMLQSLSISSLNPTLQMLAETLILPGIQNEDAGIRTAATKSLGMCCLLNRDLVMQHLPLFMQASQIDVEVVRSAALMVIFDLLHMHGLEAINNEPGETDRGEAPSTADGQSEAGAEPPPSPATTIQQEKDDERVNTASNLVAIISDFLDSESSELRTIAAEGMAKLLLSGRVVSSKIFSHLLLLWYNPVTEDDTHLRHCLGTFFPLFAFACRSNQETVEEAFLPTLKTLLNAPLSSPLAEVNEENVAELLVQLTNIRLLLENQNMKENITENPSHANIAVKVCNEVLSNPDSFNLKLWVKILNMLEICSGEVSTIKELLVLVDQIIVVIKDKQCLKSVEKFQMILRNILPEMSDNGGDMQEEPTQTAAESEVRDDTAAAIDKTVLNESVEIDTSSFFQETKVIRRATARSERSMSSLSEKSMIFDTTKAESPRRKWSQSSDSSTPEKKVMSPTVTPEIKLPPQKKPSPEKKISPAKKQTPEKKMPTPEKKISPAKKQTPEKKTVSPERPVQKDVAVTKTSKTDINTPVIGSKKKVTSRTRLSVKSTFTEEITAETSNSTQSTEQQEDLTQEETEIDRPLEDTDKTTSLTEKSESPEKSDSGVAASEDDAEKPDTATTLSKTGPKSSQSGSESESPKKSDSVTESSETITDTPAEQATAGKRSTVRSKSSRSGSEGTSPKKSKASDRLADKRSVKSPVVTRKTPSRPNSSKSGSESSPRRSKSSERSANKTSAKKSVAAKKTPSRPSSSKSGSESSSPRRSKSSERSTNKTSVKNSVAAKKTPSRPNSSKSRSESSSPTRSKSSERPSNKTSTKNSVAAKKTPSRPNSSKSGSESSSPTRSKSSERPATKMSAKDSVAAKKTPSRPNSSKSGSERSLSQRSKSSDRSGNKISANNSVASKKTPSRSNSSKSGSQSSMSQRSKSSEKSANKSSINSSVAKKSPRPNSSKSGSQSSLSQRSKSSERSGNRSSIKSTAKETSTKRGSQSSESEMTTTERSNEVKTARRSKSESSSPSRSRSRSLEKSVRRKSETETPDKAKKSTRSKSGSDSTSQSDSPDKPRSSRRSAGVSGSIKTNVENQSERRTPATRSKLTKLGSSDTESRAKRLSTKKTSKTEKTDEEKSAKITPLAGRSATRLKLGEKTLSSENKATEKSVSASTSGSQKMSRRSIDADKDVTKTTRAEPEKKTTRYTVKSTGRKASSKEKPDDSDLENSVFASPTPVRSSTRSLRNKATPDTKKDLHESLKKASTKEDTPGTRSSSRRSARR